MIKTLRHISLKNEKDQVLQVYAPEGVEDKDFPFVLDMRGDDLFEFGPNDLDWMIDMLEEFKHNLPE